MLLARIYQLLEACTTPAFCFPPTELYNEGWLLRLILDWYATNAGQANHPLAFSSDARWFSEALLPTAFRARSYKDPLAESRTHADGVIGHFTIGQRGKADLALLSSAKQFVVCEAKLFSGLSANVKNASYFDQGTRNVACIAEVLKRSARCPNDMAQLAFYVLAPQEQIIKGVFGQVMDRGSIEQKVKQRVQAYAGQLAQWYTEWFQPRLWNAWRYAQ